MRDSFVQNRLVLQFISLKLFEFLHMWDEYALWYMLNYFQLSTYHIEVSHLSAKNKVTFGESE
jgi:hypothetical protein